MIGAGTSSGGRIRPGHSSGHPGFRPGHSSGNPGFRPREPGGVPRAIVRLSRDFAPGYRPAALQAAWGEGIIVHLVFSAAPRAGGCHRRHLGFRPREPGVSPRAIVRLSRGFAPGYRPAALQAAGVGIIVHLVFSAAPRAGGCRRRHLASRAPSVSQVAWGLSDPWAPLGLSAPWVAWGLWDPWDLSSSPG